MDKVLEQAALSMKNLALYSADAEVLSATTEANLFRKENLLDERRSKRHRSRNSTSAHVITGSFGSDEDVTMLALVDSNVTTGATRLADAIESPLLWLASDTVTGSYPYLLTDLSGNGKDFTIDSAFAAFTKPQWHKADLITEQTNGSYLDSWPDSSTTTPGPSATQSGSARPTYQRGDGPNGVNSLPCVLFTKASSNSLDLNQTLSMGTAHTIVMVVKAASLSGTNYLCGYDTSNYVNVTSSTIVYAAGGYTVSVSVSLGTTAWKIIAIQRSGTSVKVYVNGTLAGSGTLSQSSSFGIRYLGNATTGSNGFDGYIAEWMYTTDVTDLASSQLTSYAARKYNLSMAPSPTVLADSGTGMGLVVFDNTAGFNSYYDQLCVNNGAVTGTSLGTSHTISMMFKLTSTSGTIDLLGDGLGTTSYLRYSSGTIEYRPATVVGDTTGATFSTTIITSTWYTLSIVRDGWYVSLYINGAQVGTTQVLDVTLRNNPMVVKGLMCSSLAGANVARSYFAEMLVTSAVDSGSRQAIADYLASKWASSTHTLSSVKFETCTDSNFDEANTYRWTLQTYTQSKRRTLRWYLGAPDNVSYSEAQSWTGGQTVGYWRLTLPKSSTLDTDGDGVADTYFEIGNVWVGTYTTLPVDFGMSIAVKDSSLVSESDAGATYIDARKRYHTVTTTSTAVEEEVTRDLIQQIEDAGVSRHCVFDIWASATNDTMKANGCYYGRVGGTDEVATFSRNIAQRDDVAFTFIESRA